MLRFFLSSTIMTSHVVFVILFWIYSPQLVSVSFLVKPMILHSVLPEPHSKSSNIPKNVSFKGRKMLRCTRHRPIITTRDYAYREFIESITPLNLLILNHQHPSNLGKWSKRSFLVLLVRTILLDPFDIA
jgi:hypothetical protein